MYAALRAHAPRALPTEHATVFQLDEYAGLSPADERSFASTLGRELAASPFGRSPRLDGSARDPDAEAARHQALLDEAPIDLAVLGLGRDGHVAFDEPGSTLGHGRAPGRARPARRGRRGGRFGGLEHVPPMALTVGLRTLLRARGRPVLVTGEAKAEALRGDARGPARTSSCPRRCSATTRG